MASLRPDSTLAVSQPKDAPKPGPSFSGKERLLQTGPFTDLTFVVEGERFPANRAVLACQSPYFESLLVGSFSEAHQSEIVVEDATPVAFQAVLRYLTLGELPPADFRPQAYELATKYGLEPLAEVCKEKISKKTFREAQERVQLFSVFKDMESRKAADIFLIEIRTKVLALADGGVRQLEFKAPLKVERVYPVTRQSVDVSDLFWAKVESELREAGFHVTVSAPWTSTIALPESRVLFLRW